MELFFLFGTVALLAGGEINADASNCTDGICGREFMAFVPAESELSVYIYAVSCGSNPAPTKFVINVANSTAIAERGIFKNNGNWGVNKITTEVASTVMILDSGYITVQHLLPFGKLGTEYVLPYGHWFLIATENDTGINIYSSGATVEFPGSLPNSSGVYKYLIDVFEFVEFDSRPLNTTPRAIRILSDKPIAAFMSGFFSLPVKFCGHAFTIASLDLAFQTHVVSVGGVGNSTAISTKIIAYEESNIRTCNITYLEIYSCMEMNLLSSLGIKLGVNASSPIIVLVYWHETLVLSLIPDELFSTFYNFYSQPHKVSIFFNSSPHINKVPMDNGWSETNKSRDRPTQLVMETELSMNIWTLFTSGESMGGFTCMYSENGGEICSPLVCDLRPLIPECYLSSEHYDGCDGTMCCGGTNNRTADEYIGGQYIDGLSYIIGISVALLAVSMASLAAGRYLKKRHSRRRVSIDRTNEAPTRSR